MISNFVSTRLEQMFSYPEGWGGSEAYELQVLLLIEIELILTGRVTELRIVMDQYSTFLQKEIPGHGIQSLSAVTDDLAAIAKHLAHFRNSILDKLLLNAPEKLVTEELGIDGPAQAIMPRKLIRTHD